MGLYIVIYVLSVLTLWCSLIRHSWISCCLAQGQTESSMLLWSHWQYQDFVPTELETAFLKYKWRLVTVLIDGALQQCGAKIDEHRMESVCGLKTDACDVLPSWTAQSALINKTRRRCISSAIGCFCQRIGPLYLFMLNHIRRT